MTISAANQLQPLSGTLIIYLLGQQMIPSPLTCVGLVCCIPSLVMIQLEQRKKEIQEIDMSGLEMGAFPLKDFSRTETEEDESKSNRQGSKNNSSNNSSVDSVNNRNGRISRKNNLLLA